MRAIQHRGVAHEKANGRCPLEHAPGTIDDGRIDLRLLIGRWQRIAPELRRNQQLRAGKTLRQFAPVDAHHKGVALAKQQARLDRQTHLERPGIGDHAPAVLGRHNQKIRVGRCGIIAARITARATRPLGRARPWRRDGAILAPRLRCLDRRSTFLHRDNAQRAQPHLLGARLWLVGKHRPLFALGDIHPLRERRCAARQHPCATPLCHAENCHKCIPKQNSRQSF